MPLFAVTAPGLSRAAATELQRASFSVLSIEDAGVTFEGDARLANRRLSIPSRILLRLQSFDAKQFSELQRAQTNALPEGARISHIEVTCHKSRLYHSGAVQERLEALFADRLNPEGSLLLARLDHDRCQLSLDTSGELLHKRGWRLQNGPAPLRETLAAGILELAFDFARSFGPIEALVDPMCGSGTFLIEAAARSLGLEPGRLRGVACDAWKLPEAPAMPPLPSCPLLVSGGDRSQSALIAAKANAERAGCPIALTQQDAARCPMPAVSRGLFVCNPPYDKRAQGEAIAFQRLTALLARAPSWPAAILCPTFASAHHRAPTDRWLGRPIRDRIALQNGGLPIELCLLAPAPSNP